MTQYRRIRILNYAINGIGIGHVMRLKAISQWMRKLADAHRVELEPFFITTSEADNIITRDGIPTFKIPSKSILRENGGWQAALSLAARDCVWSIVERTKPNLLITDTLPAGSLDEFMPFPGVDALELCEHRLFIYRPLRLNAVNRSTFDAILPKYDLIIVPEHFGNVNVYIPDMVKARVEWTGPIVSCDRSDLMDREAAIRALGLRQGGLLIYVSVGGGGHCDAEERLLGICRALANLTDVQLIVGVGPLYRGVKVKQGNVVWLQSTTIASYLAAFDVAISAAGYNSFNELMMAGVPTIFIPLQAAVDDQWMRAKRAEDLGAAAVVSNPNDAKLLHFVRLWRDKARREEVSCAARLLVPDSAAQLVARRALSLVLGEPLHPEQNGRSRSRWLDDDCLSA